MSRTALKILDCLNQKYVFNLIQATMDRKERLAYLEQKHLKAPKERLENGIENPLLKAFYNIHDHYKINHCCGHGFLFTSHFHKGDKGLAYGEMSAHQEIPEKKGIQLEIIFQRCFLQV